MISYELGRHNVEILVHKLKGRLHDVSMPRCPDGVMTAFLQLDKDFVREDIHTHGEKTQVIEGQFIIENKDGSYSVSDHPIMEGPYVSEEVLEYDQDEAVEFINNEIGEYLENSKFTIQRILRLNEDYMRSKGIIEE